MACSTVSMPLQLVLHKNPLYSSCSLLWQSYLTYATYYRNSVKLHYHYVIPPHSFQCIENTMQKIIRGGGTYNQLCIVWRQKAATINTNSCFHQNSICSTPDVGSWGWGCWADLFLHPLHKIHFSHHLHCNHIGKDCATRGKHHQTGCSEGVGGAAAHLPVLAICSCTSQEFLRTYPG